MTTLDGFVKITSIGLSWEKGPVAAQGRIHIEKINEPFLFRDRGSPAEYSAGLKFAIEHGWLDLHESGTFVTLMAASAELFA